MTMTLAKSLRKTATDVAIAFAIIMVGAAPYLMQQPDRIAHAHLLGEIKQVDKYQVLFQAIPQFTSAGKNTTLYFSVMGNQSDLSNVHMALQVSDKKSGRIVDQIPYKMYEISDISLPYTFQNNTDYGLKLLMQVKEGADASPPKPLTADFDIVVRPTSVISPQELLAGAVPFTAGLIIAVILVFKKVR